MSKPKIGRVLVVDDEEGILHAVKRILGERHEVVTVSGGEEALAEADARAFDVALVDIRMPGQDGFETLGRLRRLHPEIDVILMTGTTDESNEKLVRALRSDAYYFLLKPFEKGVLEALLDRCLSARRVRETNRVYVEELERELRHARDLQQSLLPAPLPARSRFRAEASFRPCLDVGGDVYDWRPFGRDRLLVLVADVSGHGVSAAMITAMLMASFDRIVEPMAPSEALAALRSGLTTLEVDRFVSAFVAAFDAEAGTLVFAGAGHASALLRRRGSIEELPQTGPVLSTAILVGARDSRPIPFDAGDVLLLCTDGVTEARSPSEELFGPARLRALFQDASPGHIEPILEAVGGFRGGRPASDDETLVAITRIE